MVETQLEPGGRLQALCIAKTFQVIPGGQLHCSVLKGSVAVVWGVFAILLPWQVEFTNDMLYSPCPESAGLKVNHQNPQDVQR